MLKESFIKRAIEKHGDKYSYEKIPEEFKGTDRVIITCKEHGEFLQIARNHVGVNKSGCPICARSKMGKSLSFEEFVEKARTKHGDKYEYNKEKYINAKTKTEIYCKKCGKWFTQTPSSHIYKNGCPYCNPFPKASTQEKFIEKIKQSHPNLEVLSEYKGNNEYITVRCKIHDYVYKTTPHRISGGANCQKCYDDRRGKTIKKSYEQIIKECREVHGDKYQYPNLGQEYKTNKSKITIICPIHGSFKQSINKHCTRQQGCPKCNQSHMERDIDKILKDNYFNYKDQYRPVWLKNGLSQQSLDFYLFDYNIAIECQGEQHFLPRDYFKGLEYNIKRDISKNIACEENNVKLLYIIPKKYIKYCKQRKFLDIYNNNSVLIYEDILNDNKILFEKIEKSNTNP